MPKLQTEKFESRSEYPGLFSNTGYRRTYNKTDKVDADLFEKGLAGSALDENLLMVHVQVPEDVEDIEAWLLSLVIKEGYLSLKELFLHVDLPEKEAVVLQEETGISNSGNQEPIDIIRNIIILSRCNHAGYTPGSPMILTRKRVNRCVNLVTINLKAFYELD